MDRVAGLRLEAVGVVGELGDDTFLRLVRPADGDEYAAHNFSSVRLKNFKVVYVTSSPYPSQALIDMSLPYRIVTKDI